MGWSKRYIDKWDIPCLRWKSIIIYSICLIFQCMFLSETPVVHPSIAVSTTTMTIMTTSAMTTTTTAPTETIPRAPPERFFVPPTAHAPNSPLPILLYRDVLPRPHGEASASAFLERNGWQKRVGFDCFLFFFLVLTLSWIFSELRVLSYPPIHTMLQQHGATLHYTTRYSHAPHGDEAID